jgi:hypothetical protein
MTIMQKLFPGWTPPQNSQVYVDGENNTYMVPVGGFTSEVTYEGGVPGFNNVLYGRNSGIALGVGSNKNVFIGSTAGAGLSGVSTDSVAIGNGACAAASAAQVGAICIGSGANVTVANATQIGPGTNSTGGFQYRGYNAFDSSGNYNALSTKYTAVAFSTLATCNAGLEGKTQAITDSTTVTFNATVTGGGSSHIRVYCDGTNWKVD